MGGVDGSGWRFFSGGFVGIGEEVYIGRGFEEIGVGATRTTRWGILADEVVTD